METIVPKLVPATKIIKLLHKIMLKRKKESSTYLAADRRHRRSMQIAMKVDKVYSFQPALQPSSAEEKTDLGVSRCR